MKRSPNDHCHHVRMEIALIFGIFLLNTSNSLSARHGSGSYSVVVLNCNWWHIKGCLYYAKVISVPLLIITAHVAICSSGYGTIDDSAPLVSGQATSSGVQLFQSTICLTGFACCVWLQCVSLLHGLRYF